MAAGHPKTRKFPIFGFLFKADEIRSEKYVNEAKGEAEAVRIAIEERKRIKLEAEEKEIIRLKDEELAKQLLLDEIESMTQSRNILESDEKLVAKLSYDTKGESKCTPDKIQDKFDDSKEDSLRGFFQSPESSKEEAEELSAKNKAFIKAERNKFQNTKKEKITNNYGSELTSEQLAKIWFEAEADVDDVAGGICISLFLPKLIKLKAYQVNGKKFCIEANRKKERTDALTTTDNTEYVAEFNIKGKEVKLVENDISYEYISDAGLLIIYIEQVSLTEESNKSQMKDNSFVSSFKNGFKRIFGSKK